MAVAKWYPVRQIVATAGAALPGFGLTFLGPLHVVLVWIAVGAGLVLMLTPRGEWFDFLSIAVTVLGMTGLIFVLREWLDAWSDARPLHRSHVDYLIR